jgi:hypothetical protein
MRRVALLSVAAVTVAVIVGLRLANSSGPSKHTASTSPTAPTTPAIARPERFGVPVGWTHDEAGARGAAISAVSLSGEVARAGFVTRADMINTLASKRYAPTLVRTSAAQLATVLGELAADGLTPQQIVFRELALTVHVDGFSGDAASVRVWSVVVAGAPGRGAPRQLWRTVTVELAWEDGDWRVDGWTSTGGPTPALATSAPIAGIDDIRAVVAWTTTGGA